MFKYIIMGDPHSTSNKLEEIDKLFDFTVNEAKNQGINNIIILGDLFDTHQIVHLSVMHNYVKLFNKYQDLQWICLVGNHDIPLHGNRLQHALHPFKALSNVKVMDCTTGLDAFDGIDYVPYCSEEEFFKLVSNPSSDILICHQTFIGAQYENSFYAKDGLDLSKVPYKQVISGHIHTSQSVGKCFYPGAPRWFKTSDANQDKSIWLWDGLDEFKPISTESVCQSIIKLTLNENDPEPVLTQINKRYILEITGTSRFINKMTKKYGGLAEIKSSLHNDKNYVVKESSGIDQALNDFILKQYKSQFGIDNQKLLEEIQSRLHG